MAGYPPPYPPPPGSGQDWKYQRRILRDQARAQRDVMRAQRDAYRAHMRGMRRGSIVGPLLVVAIGVIFLLIQLGHLSFYRFGDWFGRFWPLLLVGIGVVLLIEWVFDRNAARQSQETGVPYVRHSLGGGVVTLLVFIVIGGVLASGFRDEHHNPFSHGWGFNSDDMDQFLGDKHESDQSLDQAFPANAVLTINNPRGDVMVSGTSDDDKIHISVHKEVYTRSDSDADNRARELAPQISTSQSGITNAFNLTVPSLEGTHADLSITVPGTAPVVVTANHGDVHVSSIKAPVTVTANHGDVELSAIGGNVIARINNGGSSFSAHNINGSVTLDGHGRDLTLSDINGPVSLSGEFFGTTHLERIRSSVKFHTSRTDFQLARLDGEIEISPNADLSASEVLGPVTLTTRNRNITMERISGDLSINNRNGSVDLTSAPPLGNVTIENRSGSVNLTLPEQAGFTVQAETTNGDIDNDYGLATDEQNSHKKFSGTVGKGGSLIRINTSEGDISLKKANLTPLPKLPPPPPAPPAAPPSPSSGDFNITGADGSSVYIGKDGVKIISGSDGSKVIIGKDGLNIRAGSDGSSVYKAPDGTRLTENADGSKLYIAASGTRLTENADGSIIYSGSNGTRYSKNADGSKSYQGSDGTRIATNADGSQTSIGPGGKSLSDSQVRDQLRHADDEIRKTQQDIKNVERHRDEERRKEASNNNK